jgi:hypothetical protein
MSLAHFPGNSSITCEKCGKVMIFGVSEVKKIEGIKYYHLSDGRIYYFDTYMCKKCYTIYQRNKKLKCLQKIGD